MMKCIICFESATGVKANDHFVCTRNGHVFHYCCALRLISDGTPLCPICDEDLRAHPFVRVELGPGSPPPIPPRPATTAFRPMSSATAAGPFNMRRNYANPIDNLNGNDSRRLVEPPASQFQSPSYCVHPDASFKIVILGDLNVGKSSLLHRYADERFDPNNIATTGCDLRVKVLKIAGKTVRLNLWDTAGQERHRALVDMYLRKADGIIFCFDITDSASFLSLRSWYQFAQRNLADDTVKIIVGNKYDLRSQRVVRTSQIKDLAEEWNAQYMYTSAKDSTNVEAVFRSLAALILESWLPSLYLPSTQPSAPPMALERQPNANPTYEGAIRLGRSRPPKNKKKGNDDCCKL